MTDLIIGRTGGTLVDAYTEYGVRMGDGFLDTLLAPREMKDYITNESRLNHGREITLKDENASLRGEKFNFREMTLTFVLGSTFGGNVTLIPRNARPNTGSINNVFLVNDVYWWYSNRWIDITNRVRADGVTPLCLMRADFQDKRERFYNLLSQVTIDICIPKENPDIVYHLHYKGKGASHSQNLARTMCALTMKFEESNPFDRAVGSSVIPSSLARNQ